MATPSGNGAERVGDLKRFTLWETKTRFYLVAYNTSQTRFRILKVDRTPPLTDAASAPSHLPNSNHGTSAGSTYRRNPPRDRPTGSEWELHVTSDTVVYTRNQLAELLEMIREGNRASGGLQEVGRFFGIVGFVRFTSTYYMVLISRRSVVALIGGHYIYHCDETVTLPVCHPAILAGLPGRTKAQDQEEARLLHLFKQVDLSKNFYFSYTYDLTKTLQDNLTSPIGETGPSTASANPTSSAASTSASKLPSASSRPTPVTAWGHNEKFIWNHHLLLPAFGASEHLELHADPRDTWVLPLVYGFVDQAKLSVLNRTIYVTLIARRSRHFAGARFLKRGANERGQVANDVETEQIVSEAMTTPFFAPARRRLGSQHLHLGSRPQSGATDERSGGGNGPESEAATTSGRGGHPDGDPDTLHYDASPRYTSYVMMRGSIPIYWTQDSTNMSPRPPIEISLVDPYYSAAALHFDDLFHRYGTPVIVLNLIKSKEKQEREVKLLRAFSECVEYLNQFLPMAKKIRYIAWDMSRASKSHDQDVIGILEDIAEETVETTRFFHSGPEPSSFGWSGGLDETSELPRPSRRPLPESETDSPDVPLSPGGARRETILLQEGVIRVNCVDCLDRTNAAQFVIGKAAFGHQLHALGLLDDPSLPFDSDAVNMLTEMYHDLGDTIAMQYGGSALAHTTDTYRKVNQWTSHSRDVLESMKRFYANSFADADKQAAINLFLGVDPDAPDFAPYVFPEKTVTGASAATEKQVRSSSTAGSAGALSDEEVNHRGSQPTRAPSQTASHETQSWAVPFRPHYQKWYDPAILESGRSVSTSMRRLKQVANTESCFWVEYYRPSLFTDLIRHHAFKMTAVHQYNSQVAGGGGGSGSGNGGAAVAGQVHPASVQKSGAYGAIGRHIRSGSSSSVALTSQKTQRLVEYPSPFRPRGASTAQQQQQQEAHGSNVAEASARRRRLKRDSFDSISAGGVGPSGATSTPPSPSNTSVSTSGPSKALMGGVRWWMSINRPSALKGDPSKRMSRRGASASMLDDDDGLRLTHRGPSSGGAAMTRESSQVGKTAGGFDPFSFNFAGPWQAMGIGLAGPAGGGTGTSNANQPALPASFALDTVLAKVCNPVVSHEEEAEYSFYTSQFCNESLATGGGSIDFTAISALSQSDERVRDRFGGHSGHPGGGRADSSGGLSNRFIDEKDLRIYEESVAMRKGDSAAVELLLRAGMTGGGSVDPALVAYAASSEALMSTSAANLDAKLRAYSSWLHMGQTKLASF